MNCRDETGRTHHQHGLLQSFFLLPTAAVYATTKFAIRGLTESLRLDLEKYDIGVSGLIPGAVRTNIMESVSTRAREIQRHDVYWSRRRREAQSNPGRWH
ncbi:SDR family NAD(P)-dependent oxidoreductase [Mycobacterium sp. CBMA293]|uniref:SDR family NAD(P)-dependent oxidoreductase n=1 Tax=unclassified Mycolicibacterium TaxID=2636767 RepID=UPI0012DFD7F0|nr:SDR family NAD(P)-dependent oxidoreductase [Mycolicibacterium sp. CBMA 360]MUL62723.1 SDR family NAD(P)-dependent oxidoreductase [Mycolicibacterium sp. CBMA 335]MUL70729.1 SDR family NAD(P)-dependent oxidoreductase [Mycolicibacterium sp. CBMA 311]MUL97247.1 SDR family NAD(P)-dependent oxidoreductase [Mycolicibacterium sp. CBMA 230]MUM07995.1 hypothetical protein [Mycolicibacterium sp. CBMA 213]MUM15204.1 SDR family NAD(P)-dependent oxidoreductase [Mycolicibacterium sp. CBMA 293]MUM32696.1 